ncbi:MAG: alpha/beta hydrolase [Deltaproteobacteria bacterium]|nr:alpha/beta hydrolase [Deltaproteobacteria bacterium]
MKPFALQVPDEARPRSAFVLHGILGNHTNWRSFARRLAQDLPQWQFHLVDLRNHGKTGSVPGPQSLAAVADDLEQLAVDVGAPEVVVGHSFGGKVALEYAARRPASLRQAWVLDATPHAVPGGPGDDHEVARVISALRAVPQPLARRADVMGELAARGMGEMIQKWMTTNLRRDGDGYVWTFDLDGAEAMLDDYFRRDLWGPLETASPEAPAIHLVRAGASDRWTPDLIERLHGLPPTAAGTHHLLEDAGHWLHVDAPERLRQLLVDHWPGGPAS